MQFTYLRSNSVLSLLTAIICSHRHRETFFYLHLAIAEEKTTQIKLSTLNYHMKSWQIKGLHWKMRVHWKVIHLFYGFYSGYDHNVCTCVEWARKKNGRTFITSISNSITHSYKCDSAFTPSFILHFSIQFSIFAFYQHIHFYSFGLFFVLGFKSIFDKVPGSGCNMCVAHVNKVPLNGSVNIWVLHIRHLRRVLPFSFPRFLSALRAQPQLAPCSIQAPHS